MRFPHPPPKNTPRGKPPIPSQGVRAAITPGMIDGLLLALEKYGRMSFAQVAAPATEDADAFPLPEIFASYLADLQPILALWPASQNSVIQTAPSRSLGKLVHMPDLARTHRQMAAAEKEASGSREATPRSTRPVLQGINRQAIAAFNELNAGLIACEDLANFKAETDEPRTTAYLGYTIKKPGCWTQGPVMLESLNILEGFDLERLGHNSSEYLHPVIEAVKLTFADRDR
jgi:gamma-glutamyltranspeptidase/glutathione hydrolase